MQLERLQTRWREAVLGKTAPVELLDLAGPDARTAEARINVHRSGVRSSLVEALEDSYPVTRAIVGADFFRAAADRFVTTRPPRSPRLWDYGGDFADFLQTFPPARSVPYLADTARLERARIESYFAPDAEPLDTAAMAALSPDQLGSCRIDPHPATRVARSQRWPIHAIWSAHQPGGSPTDVALDAGGEEVLVTRPHDKVRTTLAPRGTARFVATLSEAATLSDAAAALLDTAPEADVARILALLLSAGALAPGR